LRRWVLLPVQVLLPERVPGLSRQRLQERRGEGGGAGAAAGVAGAAFTAGAAMGAVGAAAATPPRGIGAYSSTLSNSTSYCLPLRVALYFITSLPFLS